MTDLLTKFETPATAPPHTQVRRAGVSIPPPAPTSTPPVPRNWSWGRGDALLALSAEAFDGIEALRIASEARLGAAARPVDEGGQGLNPALAELAGARAMCDSLRALEHQALLDLQRTIRKHPLGPWIKATVGVGEKQCARLLAAIGDPRTRSTVSQLWAYCGYHVLPTSQVPFDAHELDAGGGSLEARGGVAPSRVRGQRANWNATAKMRAHLVAESCIKQARSPYRAVYDTARAKHADAVHNVECRRCGPSGSPAPPGSPLSLGHQHARGLRVVAKAVLRDLWVEARRVDG